MFLKNCWYVAGWSDNYKNELKPQKILGENIVLYRQQDGQAVALEDACPHRKLPLSLGQLNDDKVICGYHGLTFDGSGSCVAAPTQQKNIPKRAVVKSYPVIDRYRLLWIWMGDPDKANPNDIFNIENFDNPDWGYTDGGILPIECNYLWVVDNLLDPSHVAWVHVTSFAGGGTDDQPLDLEKTDDGVIVSRWIYDQPPSPYYKDLLKNYTSKKLICTNPDLIVHRGSKEEYCAGYIAKIFESLGGKVEYFGKPHKEIYKMCFSEEEKAIAIGDNLNTDIRGANNMHIDSIFISDGVHRSDFKHESELKTLSSKHKAEASYYQPQLIW